MKYIVGIGAIILIIIGVGTFSIIDRLDRARTISSLFSGAEQLTNFPRMYKIFPNTKMSAAPQPYQFEKAARVTLPEGFTYNGTNWQTTTFLEETDTAALLVLKDGQIIHEQYRSTGGDRVQWLSMSVAKSFISALIGIAVDEGHIKSIEEPITQYAPELIGSAYDNVRIKDVLQMSSGARWNEDYGDPESDINRFGRIFALGGSMNDFVATLEPELEPGSYNRYNSTDTQALGILLTNATGRSITDYMTEKLYHPMGAETDGYWLTDAEGMEMAFGGLNLTARDYAKIGEIYRRGGQFNGRQIVPADWVKASITPDAPHLMPGETELSNYPIGYGLQWWVPEGNEGEFTAIGVYNQFVYVAPKDGVTIVKLSANSAYATSEDGSTDREFETIEFFRAIVDSTN